MASIYFFFLLFIYFSYIFLLLSFFALKLLLFSLSLSISLSKSFSTAFLYSRRRYLEILIGKTIRWTSHFPVSAISFFWFSQFSQFSRFSRFSRFSWFLTFGFAETRQIVLRRNRNGLTSYFNYWKTNWKTHRKSVYSSTRT